MEAEKQKAIELEDFKAKVKEVFIEYWQSEGCSCCQDVDEHKIAEEKLAKLLGAKQYDDKSGYDWSNS